MSLWNRWCWKLVYLSAGLGHIFFSWSLYSFLQKWYKWKKFYWHYLTFGTGYNWMVWHSRQTFTMLDSSSHNHSWAPPPLRSTAQASKANTCCLKRQMEQGMKNNNILKQKNIITKRFSAISLVFVLRETHVTCTHTCGLGLFLAFNCWNNFNCREVNAP